MKDIDLQTTTAERPGLSDILCIGLFSNILYGVF